MSDNEDLKFERQLAVNRHKELKKSLEAIASGLTQKQDDGIAAAIEKQTKTIAGFVDAVKEIPGADVNVDLHQKEVVASVERMGEQILQGQKELLIELKTKHEWLFTINRNKHSDLTETINAKQIK